MIRLALLAVFLLGIAVYAWKDWYKSLCGLIMLMAVIEHPDMPKSLFGIQGLNPWNLVFLVIIMAWLTSRRREGLSWDMPRSVSILLVLYLAVILVGFFRMYFGDGMLPMTGGEGRMVSMGKGELISEYLINNIKWVIPGILLYDGCRDLSRFYWGLVSLLVIYFLLGVQVIKWMPLGEVGSGAALSDRSLKILVNEIGYHRVNLSMMLAGASWAVLATRGLTRNQFQSVLVVLVSFSIVLAQALTGGRAGYGTWAAVGLILCVIRWRKLLLLGPFIAVAATLLVPSAVERMTQGFTVESRDTNVLIREPEFTSTDDGMDLYTVTAGRNIAWRYVVPKILESPFVGYGRNGMWSTGLVMSIWDKYGESFPHPHNAYLELLLDNGLLGFLVVVSFYFVVLRNSLSLFRSSDSPVYSAVGGVSLALLLALLIASVGSQSFYPREGAVGMWCAFGLMFRVYVDRSREGKMPEPGEGAGFTNPWRVAV